MGLSCVSVLPVLLESSQMLLVLVLMEVGDMMTSSSAGRRTLQLPDDFVSDLCAGGKSGLDADHAQDVLADDGRRHVRCDAHEPAHGVDEVRDVIGRVGCRAVAPLATDQ